MPALSPRIPPGSREDIGVVNLATAKLFGMATGGGPPNLFTTLARHRRLYRPWLAFAGSLMPGGSLPRRESELLILRVAHLTGCEYERVHHEVLGSRAGLTAEQIARVAQGPNAAGWSQRDAILLRATDELHDTRTLGDDTWAELAGTLSTRQLIELPMLVGHYEMLAMTLNSLRVQPDEPAEPSSRLGRALSTLASRRRHG